mmetsp:Transcript_2816/g.4890  ORF Transcript_2816/g.4890 Transcript_2816/m.4890 type:complete len:290 (+) Transcript_2816:189-1058(+)
MAVLQAVERDTRWAQGIWGRHQQHHPRMLHAAWARRQLRLLTRPSGLKCAGRRLNELSVCALKIDDGFRPWDSCRAMATLPKTSLALYPGWRSRHRSWAAGRLRQVPVQRLLQSHRLPQATHLAAHRRIGRWSRERQRGLRLMLPLLLACRVVATRDSLHLGLRFRTMWRESVVHLQRAFHVPGGSRRRGLRWRQTLGGSSHLGLRWRMSGHLAQHHRTSGRSAHHHSGHHRRSQSAACPGRASSPPRRRRKGTRKRTLRSCFSRQLPLALTRRVPQSCVVTSMAPIQC